MEYKTLYIDLYNVFLFLSYECLAFY